MSVVPIEQRHSLFAFLDLDNQSDVIARAQGSISELELMLKQLQGLNTRLESQNRQLTALYEIGRTLASTLDLREIYWTMYRQIAQGLLGATVLFVALFHRDEQMIYGGFAIVDGEELDASQFPRMPLGDGPVSDTIRSRTPRIVDLQNLRTDLEKHGRSVQVGDERLTKSALYVPMLGGAQVVGVMQIQSYEEDAFQETDLPLVSILANQAAVALENARLFRQVQQHNAELEQHVAQRTHDLAQANDRLTELDRLKDQFISNVSHELRTPLTNVKLYLQLLDRGRPEKRAEYMGTLYREAGRLERLIEDLLDLSRLDMKATPFYLEPTDINDLTIELIQDRAAMAAARGLMLDCQLAPDLPLVMADAQRLVQVMGNLMTNAINYTPYDGIITLLTAIQQWDGMDWVTFQVRDTGRGISEQELPHLFERFFRGEAGRQSGAPGTGLGLPICKEITESMGGRITVDSQLGQGATFTVWLKPAHHPSSA
jgi:signal transduction histidine kinase